MKKIIYVFAIITLAFTSCGGGESPIIGTWQLDSVSTEELTESEKQAMMTFNADGTAESKRGEDSKPGTWKLSEDGKTLTITEEGGDPKEFSDVKISAEEFSFSDRGATVTFKKR